MLVVHLLSPFTTPSRFVTIQHLPFFNFASLGQRSILISEPLQLEGVFSSTQKEV